MICVCHDLTGSWAEETSNIRNPWSFLPPIPRCPANRSFQSHGETPGPAPAWPMGRETSIFLCQAFWMIALSSPIFHPSSCRLRLPRWPPPTYPYSPSRAPMGSRSLSLFSAFRRRKKSWFLSGSGSKLSRPTNPLPILTLPLLLRQCLALPVKLLRYAIYHFDLSIFFHFTWVHLDLLQRAM